MNKKQQLAFNYLALWNFINTCLIVGIIFKQLPLTIIAASIISLAFLSYIHGGR